MYCSTKTPEPILLTGNVPKGLQTSLYPGVRAQRDAALKHVNKGMKHCISVFVDICLCLFSVCFQSSTPPSKVGAVAGELFYHTGGDSSGCRFRDTHTKFPTAPSFSWWDLICTRKQAQCFPTTVRFVESISSGLGNEIMTINKRVAMATWLKQALVGSLVFSMSRAQCGCRTRRASQDCVLSPGSGCVF